MKIACDVIGGDSNEPRQVDVVQSRAGEEKCVLCTATTLGKQA